MLSIEVLDAVWNFIMLQGLPLVFFWKGSILYFSRGSFWIVKPINDHLFLFFLQNSWVFCQRTSVFFQSKMDLGSKMKPFSSTSSLLLGLMYLHQRIQGNNFSHCFSWCSQMVCISPRWNGVLVLTAGKTIGFSAWCPCNLKIKWKWKIWN